jgi:hypothetical protein
VTDRMEIPKPTKLVVWIRAGGQTALGVSCEGCGRRLGKKVFHYDHDKPEWLQTASKAEREAIKPKDVKLLGYECCHKDKTAIEAGERAKDYAVLEKEARVRVKSGRPLPGTKASGIKKKMNGQVEKRG